MKAFLTKPFLLAVLLLLHCLASANGAAAQQTDGCVDFDRTVAATAPQGPLKVDVTLGVRGNVWLRRNASAGQTVSVRFSGRVPADEIDPAGWTRLDEAAAALTVSVSTLASDYVSAAARPAGGAAAAAATAAAAVFYATDHNRFAAAAGAAAFGLAAAAVAEEDAVEECPTVNVEIALGGAVDVKEFVVRTLDGSVGGILLFNASMDVLDCPGLGCCCGLPDGSASVEYTTEAFCSVLHGVWNSNATCATAEATNAKCVLQSDDEAPCACCMYGNAASDTTPATPAQCYDSMVIADCLAAGGHPFEHTTCSGLSADLCPVAAAVGSCCHPKISYVNSSGVFPVQCLDKLTEYKCKLLQGTWSSNTLCGDLGDEVCPPYGACCYNEGCANWMLESSCDKLTGSSFFSGRTCSSLTPAECASAAGACCLTLNATEAIDVRCVSPTSPSRCRNMNGTYFGGETCGSLDTNTCPESPIPGACCVMKADASPNDIPATCTDSTTSTACDLLSGTFYPAAECSELSQEMCPLQVPVGSCCHPKISYVNESGVFPVQCLDGLTEYKCKLLQGAWSSNTKCKNLTEEVCPPYGACCYSDGCANWMLESSCDKLSGAFFANRKCSDLNSTECSVANPETGACCLTTGDAAGQTVGVRCISSRTSAQCASLKGTFFVDTDCMDVTLEQCPAVTPPNGACCVTVQSSTSSVSTCKDNLTLSTCSDIGGRFFTERTCNGLSATECPVTTVGSCCHPKISYVNESGVFPVQCLDKLTEYKCKLLQGTWSFDTKCSDLGDEVCPPYGACCYEEHCANWMLESSCAKLTDGTFFAGRTCSSLTTTECPLSSPEMGACCLTSDTENAGISPVRCVSQRTAAQCSALGGTLFANRDCPSLTVEECPSIATSGACCVMKADASPNDIPATCTDSTTSTACDLLSGTFYPAAECSELSQEMCPLQVPVGSCCHPKISYVNESGVFPVQCLDGLTEYKCKLLQGAWSSNTKCKNLTEEVCPPYGACCYSDGCANWMLESSCDKLSGAFFANRKCSDLNSTECSVANPETGACCLTTGDAAGQTVGVRCISSRTSAQCASLKGTFFVDTDCMDVTLEQCPAVTPPNGACCVTVQSSTSSVSTCKDNLTLSTCSDIGGRFFTERTCNGLSATECPVTTVGSCCHPKISYVNESGVFPVQCLDKLTEYKCKLLQGTWSFDTKCSDLGDEVCPPYGACCYEEHCANWMLESSCAKLTDGTFFAGRTCSSLTTTECPLSSPEMGACCLTSDTENAGISPVRCVSQRTAAQCSALGGTLFANRDCPSLTVEECPSIATSGACCVMKADASPNDIPATCTDSTTSTACDLLSGTFYPAAECSELSQEMCPLQVPVGSCCHPKISYVNESGVFPVQCLDGLTEYKCKLLQGAWSSNTKCKNLTEEVCPPYGACCYSDGCANWMLESSCDKLSGAFFANRKCSDLNSTECSVANPETGACCLTTGDAAGQTVGVRCISSRTSAQCASLKGTFFVDTDCMDVTLEQCPAVTPPNGACCVTVQSSTSSVSTCKDNLTLSTCSDIGGRFFTERTCNGLSATECPVTTVGSCCHPKISYVNESGVFPVQCLDKLTEYKCKLLQGTWSFDTKCSDLGDEVCPPYGACCYEEHCANWMLESSCAKLTDGTFFAGRTCSSLTTTECPLSSPEMGACCLTSDTENAGISPVRCVSQRTAAQCSALGGTLFANRDCPSLTVEECPSIATSGACCVMKADASPNDIPATCTDSTTSTACDLLSGTFYPAAECSELSQEMCPLQVPVGSCCHPKISYVNESGVFPVQCLDGLTEYKCKLLQGAWSSNTKCKNLTEEVCPPYGACCYSDGCANWMLESSCDKLSGAFFANRKCSDLNSTECSVANPETGACCLTTGDAAGQTVGVRCISSRTSAQCASLKGTFFVDTDCMDVTLEQCPAVTPPNGACCVTVQSSTSSVSTCKDNLTLSTCSDIGGRFFTERTCNGLSATECPVTTVGSCCHPKISYVNESGVFPVQCLDKLTEYKCKLLQGTWSFDTKCSDLGDEVCPPYGACCYEEHCANWMLESSCAKLTDGTFFAGRTCSSLTTTECPLSSPEMGACCLTSDTENAGISPVRCVSQRTAAQCSALGGTLFANRDCPSLTVEECPSIATSGACCVMKADASPNDIPATCTDSTTSTACDLLSGTFYPAAECSELSQEMCPLQVPVGSCCHPKISYVNESGVFPVQCLDGLTEYKCKLLQGAWSSNTKCKNLTEEVCPPYGACCYSDGCANWMLESSCDKLSGAFFANRKCSDLNSTECSVANPETGACCLTTGDAAGQTVGVRCISSRTSAQCASLKGTFFVDTDCMDVTLEQCPAVTPPNGACCVTVQSSTSSVSTCKDNLTLSTCSDIGGRFFTERTCNGLSATECPVTTVGSCCHPKISYVNESGVFPVQCLDKLTEYKCKLLQGTWSFDTKCSDLGDEVCPPYGACCYEEHCANWMLESSCAKLTDGTFFAGRTCSSLTTTECPLSSPEMGACCLTSDTENAGISPVRCVSQRTAAQCSALGGTLFANRDCPSLTVEECPSIAISGACCVRTSATGIETASCHADVEVHECNDLGGTFFPNAECSELTATECPVAAAVGSCCHPKISYVNESGVFPVQCLDGLTEYKCKILQGAWSSNTKCKNLTEEVCPPYGACCYNDGCANWMLESNCDKLSGAFFANRKCSDLNSTECSVANPETGACCLTTGDAAGQTVGVRCISSRTSAQCASLKGTFFVGTECEDVSENLCPALASGACCTTSADGTPVCVSETTSSQCTNSGGTWFSGSTCSALSTDECASVGACCHPDVTDRSGVPVRCMEKQTKIECASKSGTWHHGMSCEAISDDCLEIGSCCQAVPGGASRCLEAVLSNECTGAEDVFYAGKSCEYLVSNQLCTANEEIGACCASHFDMTTVDPARCIDYLGESACEKIRGTLFPNTMCANVPAASCPYPEVLGACCLMTDSGLSCLDSTTEVKCTDADGTFFRGTVCSSVPSVDCPIESKGACCVPSLENLAGVECLDDQTETRCSAIGGSWMKDGDCSSGICPAIGACCTNMQCVYPSTETQCSKGTFHSGTACSDTLCLSEVGACCGITVKTIVDGVYTEVHCLEKGISSAQCSSLEGTWNAGKRCDDVCPETPGVYGACCLDTICTDNVLFSDCKGTFVAQKPCSRVTNVECPYFDSAAKGSCCYPNIPGTYCLDYQHNNELCTSLGGIWNDGVFCDDEYKCPPLGACCYKTGDTEDEVQCKNSMTRTDCEKLPGGTLHVSEECQEDTCVAMHQDDKEYGVCCHPQMYWDADPLATYQAVPRCVEKLTALACHELGGEFHNTATDCADANHLCPAVGACCFLDVGGSVPRCVDQLTETTCTELGGQLTSGSLCRDISDKFCPSNV